MSDRSPERESFYVGYLPFPRDLQPLLIGVVASLCVAGAAVALMLTTGAPSPGRGVWEDLRRSISGRIVMDPYPVLLTMDRGDGTPGPVLIVLQGKHGASRRLQKHVGKNVTLRGTLLHRQTYFMLELSDERDDVAESMSISLPPIPANTSTGSRVVEGEIVDSKCYLGAMKPGTGKTHKDCATLCIRGGIPPVMLATGPDGTISHYLVVNIDGERMDDTLLPLIGDPITLNGETEIRSGLPVIRVAPSQVHRR